MLTDEELLQLNREGLIPGPEEDEKFFLERVKAAKREEWGAEAVPPAHWEWARLHLEEVFDFRPLWIGAFYSNRSLAPWQGGAAWIRDGRLDAIQLRKDGVFLRWYRREEILAHEAVHGARAAFGEDRYEEFFAYMASEKKWRRALGPMARRPWEVWPLLAAMGGGSVCEYGGLFFEELEKGASFCFLGAAMWIGLGFWRLIRQHGRLKRASARILEKVGDARTARAVLFRLTDDEIDRFAAGEKIGTYAEKQTCLRWRLIRKAYLEAVRDRLT